MARRERDPTTKTARVWVVRSRRALVVAAAAIDALALVVFLVATPGGGPLLDTWPLWLVLVGMPLSLTLIADTRSFCPLAAVLGLAAIGAGVVFSLVAPVLFLVPAGAALVAAALIGRQR